MSTQPPTDSDSTACTAPHVHDGDCMPSCPGDVKVGKEFQEALIAEDNKLAGPRFRKVVQELLDKNHEIRVTAPSVLKLRRALIELATAVRTYDASLGPVKDDTWIYTEEGKAFISMFDVMLDAEHVAGLWDGDRMGEGYVGGTREAAIEAALAEK